MLFDFSNLGTRGHFMLGTAISTVPKGRVRKVIYCSVAQPRCNKSLKERHLRDNRLSLDYWGKPKEVL
jgi:hypothetical protein